MATTFSTIWTAVANRARIPTADTTTLARIKQIVNDVYRDICLHEDWYWLVKRHVLVTATAYTTGTITVTTGSTAFTFSDAPTDLGTFVGRKLHVSGTTPDGIATYRITAHTADSATGLLDVEYANTGTSTATFHVWQDEYDLPTDFLSLVDAQRYGYELPARAVGPRDMLTMKGRSTMEGKPQAYTVLDFETSGDPTTERQLWIHPNPDRPYRVEVYYRRQATEMGSAEDIPAMPEEFRHVIMDGALADVYATINADETRAAMFRARYEQGLARMAVQHREVTGQRSAVAPMDQHRAWFKGRRTSRNWADRYPGRW